jgi:predicted DNA-binding transcriptional regulator AlpA
MSRESNENDDGLLLLEKVAEITHLGTSTLRWLHHKGEGPPGFKMGRRVMFRRTAVLERIREHEQARQ